MLIFSFTYFLLHKIELYPALYQHTPVIYYPLNQLVFNLMFCVATVWRKNVSLIRKRGLLLRKETHSLWSSHYNTRRTEKLRLNILQHNEMIMRKSNDVFLIYNYNLMFNVILIKLWFDICKSRITNCKMKY